jgi:NADH-quinone oxidoreductase subunit K
MIYNSLVLAVILISIGMIGVLGRRNIFILYMSIELILNGINLGFVSASNLHGNGDGHVIAVLIMAIAAAEAALFLTMIVTLFRGRRSLDTKDFTTLASKEEFHAV